MFANIRTLISPFLLALKSVIKTLQKGAMKMARKKKETKWYDVNELFSEEYDTPHWQYAFAISGRGIGKTYSVLKYMVDTYFKDESQGFYLRRFDSDCKGSRITTIFNPLENYIWDTYQYKVRYYRNCFYFYIPTEDNKLPPISECLPFCHVGALNLTDRLKGTSYPKVKTILFDEVMTLNCRYLNDEVNLFLNMVSTIFRHRTDNCRVFMMSNAVSKYCPYSDLLGIRLYELGHGEIRTLTFKNEKGQQTKFIIQRCCNVDVVDNEGNINDVVFNNFGDNGVGAMINSGEFETGEHPKSCHGYYLSNISEKEYERLIDKGTRLVGQLTPNDDLPVYFKFNESYYQVRAKIPTNEESLRLLNGQTIIGFFKVSEREFINTNPQGLKQYSSPLSFLITNSYEHLDTFYPVIVVHNLTNLPPYGKIELFMNHILNAFSQGTVIYQNNEAGQDITNILTLMNGGI